MLQQRLCQLTLEKHWYNFNTDTTSTSQLWRRRHNLSLHFFQTISVTFGIISVGFFPQSLGQCFQMSSVCFGLFTIILGRKFLHVRNWNQLILHDQIKPFTNWQLNQSNLIHRIPSRTHCLEVHVVFFTFIDYYLWAWSRQSSSFPTYPSC